MQKYNDYDILRFKILLLHPLKSSYNGFLDRVKPKITILQSYFTKPLVGLVGFEKIGNKKRAMVKRGKIFVPLCPLKPTSTGEMSEWGPYRRHKIFHFLTSGDIIWAFFPHSWETNGKKQRKSIVKNGFFNPFCVKPMPFAVGHSERKTNKHIIMKNKISNRRNE